MEIHLKKTVHEHWEAVVRGYTVKGVHVQTEIRAKFLMSRCPEKGNAKEFLRGLQLKKEELVQVGVKISNEEYLSTIISSLLDSLAIFASMQMAWTLQMTLKSSISQSPTVSTGLQQMFSGCSVDVRWTMTGQASPVIVHQTSAERPPESAECSVDND